MRKLITKLLVNLLSVALVLTTVAAPAHARSTVAQKELTITEFSSDKQIFNQYEETLEIEYCVNAPAYVTVGIYDPVGNKDSQKIAILTQNLYRSAGCYSNLWGGEYGPLNETRGENGTTVEDGRYFYGVSANPVQGKSYGGDYVSDWVTADSYRAPKDPQPKDVDEDLQIIHSEVENRIFDPYDGQEAEFTFVLNKSADVTLEIFSDEEAYIYNDDPIATVLTNESFPAGEFSTFWDGEGQYGERVKEGTYTYRLSARNGNERDRETGELVIRRGYFDGDHYTTSDPRIKRAFVTKDSFDPGRSERDYIVFTLSTRADLKVDIYKGNTKVEELLNEKDATEGTYAVQWEADDYAEEDFEYTYRIFARNDKGQETAEGVIEIEDDQKENLKPNIYKDYVTELPYRPAVGDQGFAFKLEIDADVTLEIRDGKHTVATITENARMGAGSHIVYWNGTDKYGELVDDGVYQYKLQAANFKGRDVERGYFSVEESSEVGHRVTGLAAGPGFGIGAVGPNCAGFDDVSAGFKHCEAIDWARAQGIFQGDLDGNFRPHDTISRVEAVKVILEGLKVGIIPAFGEELGFLDTDKYEWYAPYLKTAVSLGVVQGYLDGTFRPEQDVSRAEALAMLLRTAQADTGLIIPSNLYGQPYFDTPNDEGNRWYLSYAWFAQDHALTDNEDYFYPHHGMTRADMADLLYRYHLAGLRG
jgi:flagellar hook assembly protein FlgD